MPGPVEPVLNTQQEPIILLLDISQGDSTLIVYPDRSLTLVDCGTIKNQKVAQTGIKELRSASPRLRVRQQTGGMQKHG